MRSFIFTLGIWINKYFCIDRHIYFTLQYPNSIEAILNEYTRLFILKRIIEPAIFTNIVRMKEVEKRNLADNGLCCVNWQTLHTALPLSLTLGEFREI